MEAGRSGLPARGPMTWEKRAAVSACNDTQGPPRDARDGDFARLSGGAGRVIGARIEHHKKAVSTMDIARDAGLAGAPEGLVVTADEQTVGRGRHARQWVSRPGEDLLLSVVLRPRPALAPELLMLAALAAVRTVRVMTDVTPAIKWPNDVRVTSRKLCGVLAESVTMSDGSVLAVAGIGLNVNMAPDEAELIGATSLRALRGGCVSRSEALLELLRAMDDMYAALRRGETLLPEWRDRLETLGQHVNVAVGNPLHPDRIISGVAEDVDAQGRLLVRDADGRVWPVASGEVTLSRAAGGAP